MFLHNYFKEMKMRQFIIINYWAILKYASFCIVAFVVYNMVCEANDVKNAVTWINEKFTKLVWETPAKSSHHYRIEINKTNLINIPVTTYISYVYAKDPNIAIEFEDDYSYTFRAQSVDEYGALSPYTEATPFYIYNKSQAKMAISATAVSDEKPREFSLSQNFPNPVNSQTTISYFLPKSKNSGDKISTELIIYNTLGQKVKTLVSGPFSPGSYVKIWDGRDNYGKMVASGQYIYQIAAGEYRASKKMMFMK
jgi:hypothetical protein